jgi:MFS family permease
MPIPSSLANYLILALSLCLGAMSTALASPLYDIYMQHWQISTSQIGYAFIAYMLGVVFSLLFLNGLIGKNGFKKTTILGLSISILGLLYSAYATNIWHLSMARFLIGISSGLLTTATVVGMARIYPFANRMQADKISAMLTILGFGLGPLLGGLIADHTALPLQMPYLIVAVCSILTLLACCFIQEQWSRQSLADPFSVWNVPKNPHARSLFYSAGITAMCCFACFSLYAALAGTFIAQLPITKSATLVGSSISIILFISVMTQFAAKRFAEISSMKTGLILLVAACLLLFYAQASQHLWALFGSILLIGMGHGLSTSTAYFFAGKIMKKEANPRVFSSFLLLGYQGTIWPILLSSVLIDHYGMLTSIISFSILIFCGALWVNLKLNKKLLQIAI